MNVCVFGASSDVIDEKFLKSAYELGKALANNNIGLVFGGGNSGVMGECARGEFDNNGYILGVAPNFMKEYNVLYDKCTDFKFTETMSERKTYMEDNSDAFIIAPGGIGTYEEFFEVYTLKQLGRHNKAICIYNPYGYYDKMIGMLKHTIEENFLKVSSLELLVVFENIEDIINYLNNYIGENIDVMGERYAFLK